MKTKWKKRILSIAVPLLTGGLAAFLTKDGMAAFEAVNKPPLSPPSWVFPVVWTVLYVLMGISFYRIITSENTPEQIQPAIGIYLWQLFFQFCWPLLFFGAALYFAAFLWLIVLWILIVIMILRFGKLDKTAGGLNIFYLLWVSFAGYLNLGIALLN